MTMAGNMAGIQARRDYVLGNHCVENLTKPEFLGIVKQQRSYYSFDVAGYHFVVLDACFTSDGTPYGRRNFKWADAKLPAAELDWLRKRLAETPHRTLVFIHQCLDVIPPFGVRNGPAVRKILESGKLLGVIQGHYHSGQLPATRRPSLLHALAVVEGSGMADDAYAILDLFPGDEVRLRGFPADKRATAGLADSGSGSTCRPYGARTSASTATCCSGVRMAMSFS